MVIKFEFDYFGFLCYLVIFLDWYSLKFGWFEFELIVDVFWKIFFWVINFIIECSGSLVERLYLLRLEVVEENEGSSVWYWYGIDFDVMFLL